MGSMSTAGRSGGFVSEADDDRWRLEARIADDPDDEAAWLVLADHLQKLGDPQGELIALQIAESRDPIDKKTKTPNQRAFAKAFAHAAPGLLGKLVGYGADVKDPAKPPFIW